MKQILQLQKRIEGFITETYRYGLVLCKNQNCPVVSSATNCSLPVQIVCFLGAQCILQAFWVGHSCIHVLGLGLSKIPSDDMTVLGLHAYLG